MRPQTALDKVTAVLKTWESVNGVAAMDFADDIWDPNFFLSLDVYTTQDIPELADRRAAFGFAGGFQSSQTKLKDRFFVGEIPVRLIYKRCARFDELFAIIANDEYFQWDRGTYQLYRLIHSKILWDPNKWIANKRREFATTGDRFWQALLNEGKSQLENYLNDIGAAAVLNDRMFFTLGLASYFKSLSLCLFSLNRELEPSARFISSQLPQLRYLPDAFSTLMDSLLGMGHDELERRHDVAKLLTKRVIALELEPR